jgi:antitoxin component YwqK of YwqJK toxin-antitoxin module
MQMPLIGLLILNSAVAIGCAPDAGMMEPATAPIQIEEVRAKKGNLVPEGTLLETKSYYLDASGKQVLHGPDIEFFENGKKWRESEYRHGKREGLLIEWSHLTGEKVLEETYHADRREGLAVEWYFKDVKRSECTYRGDRIVGKRLYWGTNGRLQVEEVYDEWGVLTEYTAWHDNGTRAKHGKFKGRWRDVWGGPYLAGRRDGTWTYWDQGGNVLAEGQWRDGKPWEGTCIVPRKMGSLTTGEKAAYHEGKRVWAVTKQIDF